MNENHRIWLKNVEIRKEQGGLYYYDVVKATPNLLDCETIENDLAVGKPFHKLNKMATFEADICADVTVITARNMEEGYKAVLYREGMVRYLNRDFDMGSSIPIIYAGNCFLEGYYDYGKSIVKEAVIIQLTEYELSSISLSSIEMMIESLFGKRIYILITYQDCDLCKIQNLSIISLVVKYNAAYVQLCRDSSYYKQLFIEMAAEVDVIIDYDTFPMDEFIDTVIDTQEMPAEFLKNIIEWTKARTGVINHNTYRLVQRKGE